MKTGSCLVAIVFWATLGFAKEGFYPQTDLWKQHPTKAAAFRPFADSCGSTRIHNSKPYYLSALHCLGDHIPREQKTVVLVGADPMIYVSGLEGQNYSVPDRQNSNETAYIRVIAAGGCWTGFSLDSYAKAKDSQVQQGIQCMKKDWLIYELREAPLSDACLMTTSTIPQSIYILGNPTQMVYRTEGSAQFLTDQSYEGRRGYRLPGRVFSSGKVFRIADLIAHPQYEYADLWPKLLDLFQVEEKAFILTDADPVQGMSGGPVVSEQMQMLGISTVALHPDDYVKYPEAPCLDCGYKFGRHGSVRIGEIILQLGSRANDLFNCER